MIRKKPLFLVLFVTLLLVIGSVVTLLAVTKRLVALPNKFEYQNLSFRYPETLKISLDDFESYSNPDTIFVEVVKASDFVEECVQSDLFRNEEDWGAEYGRRLKYVDILDEIKNGVITPEVEGFDSLSCGWTVGNFYTKRISIDGVNGVVYTKFLSQDPDYSEFDSVYTQVVLVDEQDIVYSVVFPYLFGDNKNYRDFDPDSYSLSAYGSGSDLVVSVRQGLNRLAYGTPTTLPALEAFNLNAEIVENIINTISVK